MESVGTNGFEQRRREPPALGLDGVSRGEPGLIAYTEDIANQDIGIQGMSLPAIARRAARDCAAGRS